MNEVNKINKITALVLRQMAKVELLFTFNMRRKHYKQIIVLKPL